jgi:hypothetical protein
MGDKVERKPYQPFRGLKITPPAEELSAEPDIREYQQKRHAYEFEGAPEPTAPRRPVVLDAPLFGGKKELGTLPYSYAPVVQKALNIIYGQKTLPLYSNPVTAPVGRALDAYETAKFIQRDPTNIMNYAGAPGTLYGAGKAAIPFIGAGAGAGAVVAEDKPEEKGNAKTKAFGGSAYAANVGEVPMNGGMPPYGPAPMAEGGTVEDSAISANEQARQILAQFDNEHPQLAIQSDTQLHFTPDESDLLDRLHEYMMQEQRARGGEVNTRIDRDPDWDMSLAEGGEVTAPKESRPPVSSEYLPVTADDQGLHLDWNAGIPGKLKRAGEYFYDTMSGQKEMDPTSQEAVDAASTIAGAMTLGSGTGSAPAGALRSGASRPEQTKTFYHGSPLEFKEFDIKKSPEGIHLTEDQNIAAEYAGKETPNIYKVTANYDPERIMAASELIENQPIFQLLENSPIDIAQPYTGERFHQALIRHLGSPEAATEYLRTSGIQGMSYPAKGHFSFYDPALLSIDPKDARPSSIAAPAVISRDEPNAVALRAGISFPEPLYHATPEIFHPSEIRSGSHLGTEAAARHIIKNFKEDMFDPGEAPPLRLLDYEYKPAGEIFTAKDNWLGLPAEGAILEQMIKRGIYKPKRSDLPKPLSQMGYADWSRVFPEIAKKKGISTIKYINDIEDAGKPSYIVYDPENLKYLGTYEGKKFADGGAVADALRLAKQGRMPLHQSLARTGYEDGGAAEPQIAGEVNTMPQPEKLDALSVLPHADAQLLDVGPYQRSMQSAIASNILKAGSAETNKLAKENWEAEHQENYLPPTDPQLIKEYEQSGTKVPLDVIGRIPEKGRGTVVDPEGRSGAPLYVAGTKPSGENVPLSPGQTADLARKLARLYSYKEPSAEKYGGNWEGITFPGPKRKLPFGMSQSAMGINRAITDDKKLPGIMAHETGHVIHNYLERYENPFAGLPPKAAKEIIKEAQQRLEDNYLPTKKRKDYVFSPQEMFAESVRAYLSDPALFKQKSPETAKYLRSIINTDPRINKLLFLSQLEKKQNAAAGGVVDSALRLARSKMAYGGLPEEYMDDDRYKAFQEVGGTKTDPRSEAIGRFLPKMTYHESRDRPTAGAPTSSAAGLAQFTKGTWRKTTAGEPEVEGKSREELNAMRRDPSEAGQQFHMRMAEKLANQNADMLEKRGLPVTPQNLYGVHFGGSHGLRALAAPERTPLRKIFSPGEINANRSVLAGKTAGDFRKFAQSAMSETPRGLPTDLDFKRSQIPSNRYEAMQTAMTGAQPTDQTAAIQPQQMAYAKPPQKGFSPDLMMPHSVPSAPSQPKYTARVPEMSAGSNPVVSSDRMPSAKMAPTPSAPMPTPSAPMPAQEAPATSAPSAPMPTQEAPAPQNSAPEGPNQDILQGIEQPFMHLPDFDFSGLFADGGAVSAALRLAKKKKRRRIS